MTQWNFKLKSRFMFTGSFYFTSNSITVFSSRGGCYIGRVTIIVSYDRTIAYLTNFVDKSILSWRVLLPELVLSGANELINLSKVQSIWGMSYIRCWQALRVRSLNTFANCKELTFLLGFCFYHGRFNQWSQHEYWARYSTDHTAKGKVDISSRCYCFL